ncbi:hypothetical protein FH969_06895 [Miniimonas arenae]|uniref:Uncharacterized protein n=1 Tax=Miniimonas arenae TaxID=676201 RepID=A0A5C5BEJ0_9MICO|nr:MULTISPECIES: hypothetical protein [Miniimonas]TNU74925.1 hypothetical protein FH969_06895 [Miniimonas arenae]
MTTPDRPGPTRLPGLPGAPTSPAVPPRAAWSAALGPVLVGILATGATWFVVAVLISAVRREADLDVPSWTGAVVGLVPAAAVFVLLTTFLLTRRGLSARVSDRGFAVLAVALGLVGAVVAGGVVWGAVLLIALALEQVAQGAIYLAILAAIPAAVAAVAGFAVTILLAYRRRARGEVVA